jgi:hypothetical protein
MSALASDPTSRGPSNRPGFVCPLTPRPCSASVAPATKRDIRQAAFA